RSGTLLNRPRDSTAADGPHHGQFLIRREPRTLTRAAACAARAGTALADRWFATARAVSAPSAPAWPPTRRPSPRSLTPQHSLLRSRPGGQPAKNYWLDRRWWHCPRRACCDRPWPASRRRHRAIAEPVPWKDRRPA